MKIDARLSNVLSEAADSAVSAERDGFDGVWTGETNHDPFLPLTIAAARTSRLDIGVAAAVAFARNPMSTAYLADDLHRFANGRFRLGLGTQVGAHITQRFSMPYSHPVARMREYISALRAIWASWRTGEPLNFRGDFYQHTLMTPVFSPGPTTVPPPAIHVAAVGPRMTQLAGEIGDGLLTHHFTTPQYLRQVTMPAVDKGLAKAGRRRAAVEIVIPVFVVTAATEESYHATRRAICRQISFYAATPAYIGVLEVHGWSDLHWDLYELSLLGEWDQMSALIDDEVLEAFAVTGEPKTIASQLRARYGEHADRIVLSPRKECDAPWTEIVADLRQG